MEQKELKQIYAAIVKSDIWPKSKSMQDYAMKEAAYIVPLDNGDITSIDKPRIEKSFCFGYGYCGVSTKEEYQDAARMRDHAASSQEYFISENLKDIEQTIAELKNPGIAVYKFIQYNGQPADSHYKGFMMLEPWRVIHEPWRVKNLVNFEEVSPAERQAILTGYEEVKKAFIKRLNTYLKKYGLSKVHSWTYLSD